MTRNRDGAHILLRLLCFYTKKLGGLNPFGFFQNKG